jgi:hypothetical protein
MIFDLRNQSITLREILKCHRFFDIRAYIGEVKSKNWRK